MSARSKLLRILSFKDEGIITVRQEADESRHFTRQDGIAAEFWGILVVETGQNCKHKAAVAAFLLKGFI